MVQVTRGGFAHPGTSLEFKTGTWRVERPLHLHRVAPCHGVCPAGEDAQAYRALVEEERFREAWENLVSANPLPAITGRVCHHPCEAACNRQYYDEPIAIHNVERYLGERALKEDWPYPVPTPAPDAPKVAVAFQCTETLLHVEQVIPAIGQIVDPEALTRLLNGCNFFSVDSGKGFDEYPGVFTGGDARGDQGTVTETVGDERRAAQAMARYVVAGEGHPEQPRREQVAFEALNMNYFERAPRPEEPVLPPERRMHGCAEIEQGLDKVHVLGEGHRCFSCGNCFACDNCWTLCPDLAVLKAEEKARDGSHYVFDYDYCKGCGVCAHECPCGFILMEPEQA